MIRFYKKIQKFNWKYALGEITLIFIGITLAIWFNNWNSTLQNKAKEQQYVKNLLENLNSDVKEYNDLIKTNNERIRQINLLNRLVISRIADINCDSIQKFIVSASFVNIFNGSSTVFKDLESSGNLSLIRNDSLKSDILQYYEHVRSHQKYEDFNTRFHINTIGPFLKTSWNVGAMMRLGIREKAIKNNFQSGDCERTLSTIERIQGDNLKLQELVNHISLSGLIILMNNGEYEVLKREAENLIHTIGHI